MMNNTPRYDCAVDSAMSVIEGRWKCTIICKLASKGDMRFNELLNDIGEISSRMLSRQLKELENDGIVHREVDDSRSLKVFYSLTEKGRTLLPILRDLAEWGLRYGFPNMVDIQACL